MSDVEALRAALEETRQRLAEAEAAAAEVPALKDEVRGLELAIARRNGTPLALPDPRPLESPDPSTESEDWAAISRSEAILAMLEAEGKPMSPGDLSAALMAKGRDNDLPHYISSALNTLQKRQKVRRMGYGRWTLKRERSSKGEEGASG
jgi:hypothetical protein